MQQANLHTRLSRDVKTASSTLSAKWAAPNNVILITTSKPTTKSRTMHGLPCRIQLQKRLGRKSGDILNSAESALKSMALMYFPG